ncbi:hypothetical protein DPMN_015974 [Dreissena polymorpha]|uniref:Uncharacterized protein n=1 Tax=Dreissena polymorpha TaxID=45954 RepID=A0A9D4NDN4_DREPO|nr:hypothetical protein DPMN_015974 [Dreissena polymorpha]
MQVPRRFKRLSGIVEDCLGVSSRCPDGHDIVADCLGVSCRCIAGLVDFLAASQTVSGSPAGAKMPPQTV